MKRLVFLSAGLLLVIAAVLAGCSQAENAVETSPAGTTTAAATETTTAVEVTADLGSCVNCHTDKAMLQANSPEETAAEAESSGEG